MKTEQKVIRAKVGVLELARQLGNVSQACRVMGYSRVGTSCLKYASNNMMALYI